MQKTEATKGSLLPQPQQIGARAWMHLAPPTVLLAHPAGLFLPARSLVAIGPRASLYHLARFSCDAVVLFLRALIFLALYVCIGVAGEGKGRLLAGGRSEKERQICQNLGSTSRRCGSSYYLTESHNLGFRASFKRRAPPCGARIGSCKSPYCHSVDLWLPGLRLPHATRCLPA